MGTITNRVNRLAELELLNYTERPNDKRGLLDGLWGKGQSLIDDAVEAVVDQVNEVFDVLGERGLEDLSSELRILLHHFERTKPLSSDV